MNQLKIVTNLNQLRYAGDYLSKIGILFECHERAGLFELSCLNPNIIIATNYHESVALTNAKPDIKIVGPRLSFPNYQYDIPNFLLDELSIISPVQLDYIHSEISYYNK